MKINWKFVSAVLVLVVAYDERQLLKANKTIESHGAKIKYLADKLDANDIRMTEFDHVVLHGL